LRGATGSAPLADALTRRVKTDEVIAVDVRKMILLRFRSLIGNGRLAADGKRLAVRKKFVHRCVPPVHLPRRW